jgi:hypothetical protein
VEISRDKLNMFIIAFLIENPQYFTLQVPIKQAFKLLLELDNSFDAMIDLLYFNYGSLLLPDILRPKFSPRYMTNHSVTRTSTHKERKDLTEFKASKVSYSQKSDSHILKPSGNSKTLGDDNPIQIKDENTPDEQPEEQAEPQPCLTEHFGKLPYSKYLYSKS